MCAVVEPTLIRVPQNTVIMRDSKVIIECSSDVAGSYITWFNQLCDSYITDSAVCPRMYNGYKIAESVPSRFIVTGVNNATHVTRNVNINSTQLSDAGVYVCVEIIMGQGVQQTSSAQLVVVGNNSMRV